MANTATRFDESNALNVFSKTDVIIRRGATAMVRRFNRLRSKAHYASDQYVIIEIVYACYADSWNTYVSALEQAYKRAYLSVLPRGSPQRPTDAQANMLAKNAVQQHLSSYVTPEGYVPRSEWERKRARCHEAIIAATKAGKSPDSAIDSARNLAVGQMRQGSDDMTDAAVIDAYKALGVTYVRLVSKHDERVCSTCHHLDGEVYELDEAPDLPLHHRCRCIYVPYEP